MDGGRTFRGLAVIGNGETTIHATTIIGTITVVVPEDADVHIGSRSRGRRVASTPSHRHTVTPGQP